MFRANCHGPKDVRAIEVRLYMIFLVLQNIDCRYLVRTARQGGFNDHPQSMIEAILRKISQNFVRKITFLELLNIALYDIGIVIVMKMNM